MRAHKVYEFKRGRDVKTSLNIGKRVQIEKWFDTFAPDVEYTIGEDLSVHVDRGLNLFHTSVTHLPDGLHVDGYIDLQGTPITHLPDGLYVVWDLDLKSTPIKQLPYSLHVGGDLDLRGTPITHLPDGLHVGRNLWIPENGLGHMSDEEIKSKAKIKGRIFR